MIQILAWKPQATIQHPSVKDEFQLHTILAYQILTP